MHWPLKQASSNCLWQANPQATLQFGASAEGAQAGVISVPLEAPAQEQPSHAWEPAMTASGCAISARGAAIPAQGLPLQPLHPAVRDHMRNSKNRGRRHGRSLLNPAAAPPERFPQPCRRPNIDLSMLVSVALGRSQNLQNSMFKKHVFFRSKCAKP